MMRLWKRDTASHRCSICDAEDAAFQAKDGWLCQTCLPIDGCVDSLSVDDVRSIQMKDPELLKRVDIFTESRVFADLRFDDEQRLFFKGPYPNRCIPILSYSEISGYSIDIDGRTIVFNSLDGERSVFRVRTDEYINRISRNITDIVLNIESSRYNVKVRPYIIRSMKVRARDSRSDCLRFAIEVSDIFDSIIEDNIVNKNKTD